MCFVAATDRKITPDEVSYLKKYTRLLLNLDKHKVKPLVTLYLANFTQDKTFTSWQSTFEAYLKDHSPREFRLRLLQSIFAISRSDLSISSSEKEWIRQMCYRLGVDNKEYAQEHVDASTILMNKKKEALKEFPTTQKECDELKIVSMSDFAQDLLAS